MDDKKWEDMTDAERASIRRRKSRTMVFRFTVTLQADPAGTVKGPQQWMWDEMTETDRAVYLHQLARDILSGCVSVDIDTANPLYRDRAGEYTTNE